MSVDRATCQATFAGGNGSSSGQPNFSRQIRQYGLFRTTPHTRVFANNIARDRVTSAKPRSLAASPDYGSFPPCDEFGLQSLCHGRKPAKDERLRRTSELFRHRFESCWMSGYRVAARQKIRACNRSGAKIVCRTSPVNRWTWKHTSIGSNGEPTHYRPVQFGGNRRPAGSQSDDLPQRS